MIPKSKVTCTGNSAKKARQDANILPFLFLNKSTTLVGPKFGVGSLLGQHVLVSSVFDYFSVFQNDYSVEFGDGTESVRDDD